ncbi:MAG: hypothetical protein QGF53_11365, partial [Alphaproteobacteria bacterium]|nr:hypothetical protein [Alphaproteobacteria bacterium]
VVDVVDQPPADIEAEDSRSRHPSASSSEGFLPPNEKLRDPAKSVEPPRPVRREMSVLGLDEVVLLLDAAKGSPLYVPVLLAVGTGMRRSEVLGLRWGTALSQLRSTSTRM